MKIFLTKFNFSQKVKELQKNFFYNSHNSFSSTNFQHPLKNNCIYNTFKRNLLTSNSKTIYSSLQLRNFKGYSLFKLSAMYMRSAKSKLKLKYPNKKYKMKTKKGLAKRITIVGRIHDRGFKFKSPGARHKMINKSKANKRY